MTAETKVATEERRIIAPIDFFTTVFPRQGAPSCDSEDCYAKQKRVGVARKEGEKWLSSRTSSPSSNRFNFFSRYHTSSEAVVRPRVFGASGGSGQIVGHRCFSSCLWPRVHYLTTSVLSSLAFAFFAFDDTKTPPS
jgi:hypothetical protein